ncbi:phage major capsid protein [Methylocystis suflitae]|uniref:phage major capsid protein n=1 Tax=Methylocystis suflitae TaxID=2951405 RepID=UPI00210F1886|nr:hypothetical protein [Methylocystis suflitae]MCQ4191022.1 hypothetical protein [Methylocystis suflitae]
MRNLSMRNRPPGEIFTRAIAVRPNTFDRATRSFTGAVLATSRPIRVRGGIMESLDLASAQFPESLPLNLDHHSDVRSTVGRVTNLRVQGDELIADGRLTADASIDWLAERIADGTAGSLSIGYRAASVREGAGRSRLVVPELVHAAIVSEPADSRAGIRSADNDDDDGLDEFDDGGTDLYGDVAQRNARVRSLCRTLGLPREIEERAIDGQWSDRRIMDQVLERSGGADRIRSTRGHVTLDDPATFRQAARDSLLSRMTGEEPQGPARELAGLSWAEFHRRYLRQAGHNVAGLSDHEVIVRALSVSDIPLMAGETFNVAMRRPYEAALSPSAMLAGTRNTPDFRVQTEVLADWTTLQVNKVLETGEFRHSYISEDGERYSVFTVGGITDISRQAYINSQGRFGTMSDAYGRRLAADVNDRRVGYLTQASLAGPTMRDENPVFYAARNNIAPCDTTSLDTIIESVLAARAVASKRKGAGDVMIGQVPTFWLVPSEFEGTALRAIARVTATTSSAVNPLAGLLQVVTEPRLVDTDTSYLACAPANMDGLVQVGMEGGGPYTESRWAFEKDALQLKIRLDLGFGWIDWRSWTRLDHEVVTP